MAALRRSRSIVSLLSGSMTDDGDVAPAPRPNPRATPLDQDERAPAVRLRLECPVVERGRRQAGAGEHRTTSGTT